MSHNHEGDLQCLDCAGVDVDAKVLKDIEKYGQSVMFIFPSHDDDGVPFAYTVGRTIRGEPELLLTGALRPEQSMMILNDLDRRSDVRAGNVLTDYLENDLHLRLIEADPEASEMNMALRMFGTIDAVQVVWPDRNNKFPGEGWEYDDDAQPLFRMVD